MHRNDVRVYPFRSNRKRRALFCVTKLHETYNPKRVLHEQMDTKELDHVTRQLKHAFNITEHADSTWSSSGETDVALLKNHFARNVHVGYFTN